jgi:hypothetical protein
MEFLAGNFVLGNVSFAYGSGDVYEGWWIIMSTDGKYGNILAFPPLIVMLEFKK